MIRRLSSGGAFNCGAAAGSAEATTCSAATSSRQTAHDSRWQAKTSCSRSVSAPSTYGAALSPHSSGSMWESPKLI
jgi:hypothetical protein